MKYDEIEDYILLNINTGVYKSGQKIESENNLSSKFNVSRMTVRRAIENLIHSNYLYREQGKGTFVKNHEEKLSIFLNEIIGFSERAKRQNLHASTKILKYNLIRPNKSIQDILLLPENENVYYVERLRYINDEALVLEITYIPEKYVDKSELEVFFNSKYEYAKKKNLNILKLEKEFMGILPSREIKEALKIRDMTPVFKQKVIAHLDTGDIFEYTEAYYNQEKYKFVEIVRK